MAGQQPQEPYNQPNRNPQSNQPRSFPYGQVPQAHMPAQGSQYPPNQPYPPRPQPQPGQPNQPSQFGNQAYLGSNNPQQPRPSVPGQAPFTPQQPYAQRPNPYAQPAAPAQAKPYASPGAAQQIPYYSMQPKAKKRGLSGGGVAAIVIAVILVPILLFAAIMAGFAAMANKAVNDAMQQAQSEVETPEQDESQSQTQSQPEIEYITMKDRPSYKGTYDYVNGKYEQYSQEALADTQAFMDKYRIPITDDGNKYVTDFIAVLGKYATDLKKMGDTVGVNASEMDDVIASYRTNTDTVEGHFLKGEPLDVQVTLQGSNGETYTVDGQNSVDLKPLWADLEPKVAAASNDMGSNYAESAQKIVELAGLQINWNLGSAYQYCTKSAENSPDMKTLNDNETFGFYCPVTPNVIYANQQVNGWDSIYAPSAGIRHEIAHHAIHMYCGTIQPPVVIQNGVNRFEGVTNSYAVKYLGADANLLSQSAQQAAANNHRQYLMDDFTDKAAEAIHRGECEAIQ